MADNDTQTPSETPVGDQLEAAMTNGDHGPELAAMAEAGPPRIPDSPDGRASLASLTDRDLLERVFVQLGYLVDTLAPHGRVVRALDLVADAYGPSGPLFGRLDHADVQAHAQAALLDQIRQDTDLIRAALPKLDRLDQFIADNKELIERGKKMMGTTDAIRAAMPGGHRRRGK